MFVILLAKLCSEITKFAFLSSYAAKLSESHQQLNAELARARHETPKSRAYQATEPHNVDLGLGRKVMSIG